MVVGPHRLVKMVVCFAVGHGLPGQYSSFAGTISGLSCVGLIRLSVVVLGGHNQLRGWPPFPSSLGSSDCLPRSSLLGFCKWCQTCLCEWIFLHNRRRLPKLASVSISIRFGVGVCDSPGLLLDGRLSTVCVGAWVALFLHAWEHCCDIQQLVLNKFYKNYN